MKINAQDIVNNILQGDKPSLSRAITWAESSKESHQLIAQNIIQQLSQHSKSSVRIGITGVPGAGKSTFIEALGEYLITLGHKVAVLSVDPSSNKSKGSILGDKTRMEKLSANDQAFIRPTASGLHLGGLNNKTYDAVLLCEAAGYDVIIIETVGVGQNEVEVSLVSDFFLLLAISGAGDELQGVKRGIMEMCHAIVINKSDGENIDAAKMAQNQIRSATQFLPKHSNGWKTPVLRVSSITLEGIEEVWRKISEYMTLLKDTQSFEQIRNQQKVEIFKKELKEKIWNDFIQMHQKDIDEKIQNIQSSSKSIYIALKEIFKPQ